MRACRGKRTSGTFTLAARAAAGRFASGRWNARGRRDAWRSIVLRWRQKHKRLENVRAGHAAPAARALWFPQFHLHFSTPASDPTQRGVLSGFHTATTIHESRRIVCGRQWMVARAVSLATLPRRGYRSSRVFHVDKPLLRRIDAVMRASTRLPRSPIAASIAAELGYRSGPHGKPKAAFEARNRSSIAPSIAAELAYHSGPHGKPKTAFEARNRSPIVPSIAAELAYRSDPHGEPKATFEIRKRTRQRERQVFRPRALTLGNSVPRRLDGAAVRKTQFGAAPELLWRQTTQTSSRIAGEGSLSDIPRFSHRTATGFPQQEPTPEVPPLSGRTASLQVTKLDPSLLERLTDDVIRRVEQRVRINRERRGL